MRNHGSVGLQRDPNDVQCGREIDRMFSHYVNIQYARVVVSKFDDEEYEPGIKLQPKLQATIEKKFPDIVRSIIHLYHYDIHNMQTRNNFEAQLSALRVSYLCKDFNLKTFRRKVFNLNRNREIARNILDLLVAVKNAATDILYRVLDDMTAAAESLKLKSVSTRNDHCRRVIKTMDELDELHVYAQTCIDEIYWAHSMKPTQQFKKSSWFALTN
jgi:hypothetical protein